MARLTLLGVEVDPLTVDDLHALIAGAVERAGKWIIANQNLHSIYLCRTDPKLRAFYSKAGTIHIDGMALIFWARLLGIPLERNQRVTYADWVYPLMSEAARKGWKIFYLGSKPGTAEKAAGILQAQHPSLQICTAHGYFSMDGEQNQQVLEKIREYGPHVLMVGMGMPRQEHWILDNLGGIRANAILCAGACFDYVAGAVPVPPRWMGQIGLEWLYRMVAEPGRLWHRYLVEPWFLLPRAWRDLTHRTS